MIVEIRGSRRRWRILLHGVDQDTSTSGTRSKRPIPSEETRVLVAICSACSSLARKVLIESLSCFSVVIGEVHLSNLISPKNKSLTLTYLKLTPVPLIPQG